MVTIWQAWCHCRLFVAETGNGSAGFIDCGTDDRIAYLLSTGIDSPVTIDSSMLEDPSVIFPSTGTFSPGGHDRMSTLTSSMGTSISFSVADDTSGFLPVNVIIFLIASLVCAFALGLQTGRRISVMIAAVYQNR